VGKNTKLGTRRGTKKLARDSGGFRDRQFKLTEKAYYREKWFEFDIAEKFEIYIARLTHKLLGNFSAT